MLFGQLFTKSTAQHIEGWRHWLICHSAQSQQEPSASSTLFLRLRKKKKHNSEWDPGATLKAQGAFQVRGLSSAVSIVYLSANDARLAVIPRYVIRDRYCHGTASSLVFSWSGGGIDRGGPQHRNYCLHSASHSLALGRGTYRTTQSPWLTHTHTHTHTLTLTVYLTHSLTHSLSHTHTLTHKSTYIDICTHTQTPTHTL